MCSQFAVSQKIVTTEIAQYLIGNLVYHEAEFHGLMIVWFKNFRIRHTDMIAHKQSDKQLTTATLRARRDPLPSQLAHLISPRDPQVEQGIFPLPLHLTHLQEKLMQVNHMYINRCLDRN